MYTRINVRESDKLHTPEKRVRIDLIKHLRTLQHDVAIYFIFRCANGESRNKFEAFVKTMM